MHEAVVAQLHAQDQCLFPGPAVPLHQRSDTPTENGDGTEERKTDLVLKESEQSTLHDYRESWDAPPPPPPTKPTATHINHFIHHTHVISTTAFMAVAI